MYENIAGMRFGRLVAEKYIGEDNYGKAIWECRCDCGSLKIAKATNLKTGNVTSCGCKRKPGNRYILNREYGKAMSIIISTMEEIPENCCDCPCADHENGRCQADKEGRTTQVYRPFWCPLKEQKSQELCCENRANEPDGYKGLYGFNDR